MINPSYMPRNISFRTETLYAGKTRVGRLRPDENGIYKGLPMMVLGQATQQNTYYDPMSVVDQITNPETRFYKVFKQNKACGEWGHPVFSSSMSKEDVLARLVTVDEKNVSHVFTSFYTDNPASDNSVILRADLKPTGPYGAALKEGLDDPVVNPAFSLRAYVDNQMKPNGLKYRVVRQLTSFDFVYASGYATTDKANALGLESFAGDSYHEYEIAMTLDGNLMIDQVALETYSDTDLNEIFGTSSVSKVVKTITMVKPDHDLLRKFPNLYTKTIFNDFFKE